MEKFHEIFFIWNEVIRGYIEHYPIKSNLRFRSICFIQDSLERSFHLIATYALRYPAASDYVAYYVTSSIYSVATIQSHLLYGKNAK